MRTVTIAGRAVPAPNEVYVIAEAGVNHNVGPALAHRLVDVAADSGADAVKFQTFDPAKLVPAAAASTPYQRRLGGSPTSGPSSMRSPCRARRGSSCGTTPPKWDHLPVDAVRPRQRRDARGPRTPGPQGLLRRAGRTRSSGRSPPRGDHARLDRHGGTRKRWRPPSRPAPTHLACALPLRVGLPCPDRGV